MTNKMKIKQKTFYEYESTAYEWIENFRQTFEVWKVVIIRGGKKRYWNWQDSWTIKVYYK